MCTCKKIEDVSVNIKTHVQKHYKIVAENKEENMAEILKKKISNQKAIKLKTQQPQYLIGGHRWMHIWGKGGWSNHPIGGNAIGRGVKPAERGTDFLVTTA